MDEHYYKDLISRLASMKSIWKSPEGSKNPHALITVTGDTMAHAFKKAGYTLFEGTFPIPKVGIFDHESGQLMISDHDREFLDRIAIEQAKIEARLNGNVAESKGKRNSKIKEVPEVEEDIYV